MHPFLAFTLSLFTTAALIPLLIRVSERYGLADQPGGRKGHDRPVPCLGGVAMAAGVWLPIFLWLEITPALKTVLIGMALVTAVGLLDDILGLDWKSKLLVQVGVSLLAVLYGKLEITHLGYWWGHEVVLPAWAAIPITVVFIVGVTNAINLADGLDGLAAGICLFIFGLFAVLAYVQGITVCFVPLAAIAGAICGFLRFNTHPAIIFMGDSGSYLLGFSAAVFAILCTQEVSTAVAPTVTLLILGIPIVDTLVVMSERLLAGQSPFHADRRHVHYRLMRLGLTDREAVILIYLAQALLAYLALYLIYDQDSEVAAAFAVFVAVVGGGLYAATRAGWRFRRTEHPKGAAPGERNEKRRRWLVRRSFAATYVLVSLYLAVGTALVPFGRDKTAGLAAGWIPVSLAACYFWRQAWFPAVSRVSLFLLLVLVTLALHDKAAFWQGQALAVVLLVTGSALALSSALYIKFAGPRLFSVTPLDILIVLVTVAITLLPTEDLRLQHLDVFLVSLVVLFFGVEVVLSERNRRWGILHSVACVCALVQVWRALA